MVVYPSEYDMQRMKEEGVYGHVGLFYGENDEDENIHEENDVDDIDKHKLCAYDKSRLIR